MKIGESVLGYTCDILTFQGLNKKMPDKELYSSTYIDPKNDTVIDSFIKSLNSENLIGFVRADLVIPENVTNLFLRSLVPINDIVFLPTLRKFLECGVKITAVYKIFIYSYNTPYKMLVDSINKAEQNNETYISELTNILKETDKLTEHINISPLFVTSNKMGYPLKLPNHHIQAIAGYVELELLNFYQLLMKYFDLEIINVQNDMIYISFAGNKLEDVIKPDMKGKVDLDKIGLSNNGLFKIRFIGELCFYNSNIVLLKSRTIVYTKNENLVWACGKLMVKYIDLPEGFNAKPGDIICKSLKVVPINLIKSAILSL